MSHPHEPSFILTQASLQAVDPQLVSCLEALLMDEVACSHKPATRAVFLGPLAAMGSTAAQAVNEAAVAEAHVGRLNRLLTGSHQVLNIFGSEWHLPGVRSGCTFAESSQRDLQTSQQQRVLHIGVSGSLLCVGNLGAAACTLS